MKSRIYLATALALLLTACGTTERPLDADTREAIDSIYVEQVRMAREELDSLCKLERQNNLTRLVDSIKRHRLEEMAEKLRTVPK